MRTHTQTLLVLAAVLAWAPCGSCQDAAIDPRWLAYLGCWEPDRSREVRDVRCPHRRPFDCRPRHHRQRRSHGTGAHRRDRPACRDHARQLHRITERCVVPRGQRLYLHSEDACSGETGAGGTGLIAMSGDGRLLYIQSMTIGTQTGVRVQRYREATADLLLPTMSQMRCG